MESDTQAINWDKKHCWHPFTRQSEWCAAEHKPLLIESGKGVWLTDSKGNSYIDGNASIWTNIHGHNHPYLNNALQQQSQKIAHSSYLGFAHPQASKLAARLAAFFPETTLQRVFFSDNGSTAIEAALKIALQYRLQNKQKDKINLVAFHHGYHGDTLGAASLSGTESFFARFRQFGMQVHFVSNLEELKALPESTIQTLAAVVIEPLVQGVNQMHVWQQGMLAELREWTEKKDIHLILDEVMTGFGRTGTMFACQAENVVPDFLCLAKGLTGGYMPMAATLVREEIYTAFLGEAENTFYYGHSYTANPLACSVALASLDLFEQENTLTGVEEKALYLERRLATLAAENPYVFAVRQCGLIAGIEIRNIDGTPYPVELRKGEEICKNARNYQLLTRPILDTLVFLPPLSITRDEIDIAIAALEAAIQQST